MIAVVLLHMASVYFLRSYRKPREVMWFSGALLLFLVLGFAFTGYLLPWDTTAYFATQIGTEIPRTIPVVGELLVNILRGGDYIAEESLKRLFALHAIILPLITLVVVAFHLILNQVHGPSVPIGANTKEPSIPFYPNYIYRDAITWSVAVIFLALLSIFAPVAVGAKVNPFASAPVGIKPEWYFLPLFETLRLFPSQLWGLDGEMLVNIGVGVFGLLLVLVPVIDRKAARGERSVLFQWVGVVTLCYLCVSIFLAYTT
jgi:cytochrome b6